MRVLRKLRHALCVLRGGHTHYWPMAHSSAFIACCSRCGHIAVIDNSDRPVLRYVGIAKARRVS